MNILSTFKIAVIAINTHRLRSALTILGIVIGITSVIIVFSAGEALRSLVTEQVSAWGSDWVEVEVKIPSFSKTSSENATGQAAGVTITTLTEDDATAIKKNRNISEVYSALLGQGIVTYREASEILTLWGTNESFLNIDPSKVAEGRFFSDEEDKGQAKVAVIGAKTREKLFGESDALDKTVKISNQSFKVIGIMEEKGAGGFVDMDNMIFLPLKTLQKQLLGVNHVSWIVGKLKDTSLTKATANEITLVMRDRHEIDNPEKDDFAVNTMEEAITMINSILGGVTLLLVAIAAISLIVGGVGIMNIMFVSVTERTNEIGLRKAIGAKPRNILIQFLWEAIILTFSGGILGIIFGLGFSYLTSIIATSQGFNWQFSVKPVSLVIAVGVAVAIGLVFGLYPAKRASQLDPIEALRYEY